MTIQEVLNSEPEKQHKNDGATTTHRETGRRLENGTRISEDSKEESMLKGFIRFEARCLVPVLSTHLPVTLSTDHLSATIPQHFSMDPDTLFRHGRPRSFSLPFY